MTTHACAYQKRQAKGGKGFEKVVRKGSRGFENRQKPVVESLVVSLAVIVLDVLPREEAQVAVPERDHGCRPSSFILRRPTCIDALRRAGSLRMAVPNGAAGPDVWTPGGRLWVARARTHRALGLEIPLLV